MTVGDAIRHVRKYTGIRMQTCAAILGVSVDDLKNIETNNMQISDELFIELIHGGIVMLATKKASKNS